MSNGLGHEQDKDGQLIIWKKRPFAVSFVRGQHWLRLKETEVHEL